MSAGVKKTEPYEVHMVHSILGQILGIIQYCECEFLGAMWMDVERTAGST